MTPDMRNTGPLMMTAWLVICGCKKDKPEQPTGDPVGKPVNEGSAAKPAQLDPPKPDDSAAGKVNGVATAMPAGAVAGGGSAPPPASVSAAVKFGYLPGDWTRTDDAGGGKLEYVAAVNQSDFPVDNAVFTFGFLPVSGEALPTKPAEYGSWWALQTKTKVNKTEKLGDAYCFEFPDPNPASNEPTFTVAVNVRGQVWQCGGTLYRDKDHNKIAKVRDKVIAEAKKICASMQ